MTDMARPTAAPNALTTLDEQAPTSFHWQLTLLATVGGFLFSYDTSRRHRSHRTSGSGLTTMAR